MALTPEEVHQFRAILSLGWSLSRVRDHFNRKVSISYLSKIKSGKNYHCQSSHKKKPGPKPSLSKDQIRELLKSMDNSNPPTLRDMASKYNVSHTLISRIVKRSGRRKVTKPKVHALTKASILKRYSRSWQLYRLLRKNRWTKVVQAMKPGYIYQIIVETGRFNISSLDKKEMKLILKGKFLIQKESWYGLLFLPKDFLGPFL